MKKALIAISMISFLESCSYINEAASAQQQQQITYQNISPCYTCLRLIPDPQKRTNQLGNPLYLLEVYLDGQVIYTLDAVTGRAYSQQRNRNVAGTEAPLPDGEYRISNRIVSGAISEVGGTFIAVYPRFRTGRSDLGIHYDPSFNQFNGEDGTSGCIGLTNKADRNLINQFVKNYYPQELIVDIE